MMNKLILLLTVTAAAIAASNNNVVAVNLLGIDGGTPNILYNFVASNPALVKSKNTIQGLSEGETLLAIAKYPNSTDFYGLSANNKIYHLNATTAQATFTSTLTCDTRHSNPPLSIAFDPSNGRLHVLTLLVESTTNHFEANIQTGECQSKPALFYGSSSSLSQPSPTGLEFYNGDLYVVDANSNSVLSTLASENSELTAVGSLNHQFSGVGGFSIAADSGRYYGLAALYTPYESSLWAINLQTGNSFQAADLGGLTTNLVGFAVLANGQTVDYPFPNLGTVYDPEATYQQVTGTNTQQEALFGTSPANTNGNTNGNGNTATNGNGNTATNGNGNGNTATATDGNGNGNTATATNGNGNGNTGSGIGETQVVTGPTYTATVSTPSASNTNSASFTTQVTTQGTDRVTATDVGTVFPVGTGFTESITFTKTIAAYDYRGASEQKTAVVVLATNEPPRAAFTGTVLVGQGTNTVVEEAGIAIPAGVSATVAVREGSSTVEGVLLLNGAAGVTIGQLSDVSAGQTAATAIVTIADEQGRTSEGVASFALPASGTNFVPNTVQRQQGSASSVMMCFTLVAAAIVLVM